MIGIDLVAIARINRLVKKYGFAFLERFLDKDEIALCVDSSDSSDSRKSSANLVKFHIARIAGFYAAKEAIAKALGSGISKNLAFCDIKLRKNSHGAPKATLSKRAKKYFGVKKIKISITHEISHESLDSRDSKDLYTKGFAIAVAIVKK